MKILFVSSQMVFRETRFGGAKRLYYLAKELESRAELDVICLDGCEEVTGQSAPSREFNRLLFVPTGHPPSLLEKFPFLPDVPKALKRDHRDIAAFIGGTRYDATLLAYPGALHFLDRGLIPHPGRTVYLEDDLFLEQMRVLVHQASKPARRLLNATRRLQAERFYRKNLKGVSEFVCISPQEELIVRARWPGLKTNRLGYGLPLKEYPLLPPPGRNDVLGFIGNYRHVPNLDAARWLVESLFPAVLSQMPEARLILCGAGFPDEIRKACAGNGSIEILDDVVDLADFYRSISVFVNPVREGRGLRTKVVEAAAFGRLTLSTSLGAEGLENFNLDLFGTGEELVARLRAISPPGAYAEKVRQNRAEVERLFSMESIGKKLMDILSPK